MSNGEWVAIVEVTDPDEQIDDAQIATWMADGLAHVMPRGIQVKIEVREVERA